MKLTRRDVVATAGIAAAAGALPGRSRAATEIKFGHVGEPGSLFETCANEFARRANAALGDAAKVVVFGSSQLGSDSDMVKKLKLGTIDMALPSTVMSSFVPEFALFEMPYLVANRDHMRKIRDAIVLPTLGPLAAKQGYHLLGTWENGFRQITNNKRPINKPEDLQGIKLRVPNGVWRVRMFQSYGANPSPMAYSEVFVALQTGVMDGQENPLAQIYPARFQEVQKYLSLTSHVYTPAYVMAGRSWDRLPEAVRKTVQKAAEDTQDFVYQTAAKLDDDLLGKLKEAGMEVNQADRKAFVAASKPIYARFGQEVPGGGDLVGKAEKLA